MTARPAQVSFILLFLVNSFLSAGDQPKSVVFKSYKIPPTALIRRNLDLSAAYWEEFQLVQKANTGDPIAQHELGLRYLMGDGFIADTVKAVYWVRKAADQNLPLANYNYGIFLNNGVGIEWNPYEAYRRFQRAAKSNIPQAQYMVGVFLSDELAVQRDLPRAYHLFKTSADSGFEPAKQVLVEFAERGWDHLGDTSAEPIDTSSKHTGEDSTAGTIRLVSTIGSTTTHLDADTVPLPKLEELVSETFSYGIGKNEDTAEASEPTLTDSSIVKASHAADWGSPEAATLLGYCAQFGIILPKDEVHACAYYLAAMRLDSPRAPFLLYRLIHRKGFFDALKSHVNQDDPEAQFVWAGLCAFGLDNQLTDSQALEMLKKSASRNNVEAILELALCCNTGKWVAQDRQGARSLMRGAMTLGNMEAGLRLVMIDRQNRESSDSRVQTLSIVLDGADHGSVLAEEILGYGYAKGFLVGRNISESVRYYRMAAQRGSLAAYHALKELYDGIRPPGREFKISE